MKDPSVLLLDVFEIIDSRTVIGQLSTVSSIHRSIRKILASLDILVAGVFSAEVSKGFFLEMQPDYMVTYVQHSNFQVILGLLSFLTDWTIDT